jgi:hypothetical protein
MAVAAMRTNGTNGWDRLRVKIVEKGRIIKKEYSASLVENSNACSLINTLFSKIEEPDTSTVEMRAKISHI